MTTTNWILGLSHIGTGALLILISLPLLHDKIKPNAWYGIRLAKSFESSQNWYAINRFGARRLIFWSVPIIAVGIICLILPISQNAPLMLLFSFAPAIFILIALWEIFRFAKTL